MRIGVTSDLHGYLPEIEPCDILCICGDICPTTNHSKTFQEKWLFNEFKNWINAIPVISKVIIAGNHDFWFEGKSEKEVYESFLLSSLKHTYCLYNSSITFYPDNKYKKIKIFGTPYCKQFGNWAFMRDSKTLDDKYFEIPNDVDILLSHDAPMLLDVGVILDSNDQFNAGNPLLADYVLARKPKYVFCGHIHSGNHNLQTVEGIKIANVSLVDEDYQPVNKVLYFNY